MISETKLNIPIIRIEPARGWVSLKLGEIWPYRELLYFLVWRDVKVRYKQTAIGAAWAIIQPLLTMVIFTLVFDKFAKVPSNGLPYPIFSFAALLPWTYFSKALEYPMRLDNPALTRAHLGWALFHQKRYVDAAKELRQAKQFQPNMCVATYRLARVYFAREEWEKAAELFQTASDDPSCGSQEASYYLMKTRMQQGLGAEAKVARDACLKISPQSCIASQCRADGRGLGH